MRKPCSSMLLTLAKSAPKAYKKTGEKLVIEV
jgi:hypothetical protein